MAKKAQLPKRIAGIKLPKRLRKGPIGQFLCSRTGQAMIAEALVIAGGAVAAKRAAEPGSATSELLSSSGRHLRRAGRAAAGKGQDAQQFMGIATERLAYAGLEAVRAFRRALTGEEPDTASDEHDEKLSDTLDKGEAEGSAAKKKISSSRSESAATPH
jgi:hypothetical protein